MKKGGRRCSYGGDMFVHKELRCMTVASPTPKLVTPPLREGRLRRYQKVNNKVAAHRGIVKCAVGGYKWQREAQRGPARRHNDKGGAG